MPLCPNCKVKIDYVVEQYSTTSGFVVEPRLNDGDILFNNQDEVVKFFKLIKTDERCDIIE